MTPVEGYEKHDEVSLKKNYVYVILIYTIWTEFFVIKRNSFSSYSEI